MGRIGIPEIIIVVCVIILLFGARKLPEIGKSLGKAIREFKKAGKELDQSSKDTTEDNDDGKKS